MQSDQPGISPDMCDDVDEVSEKITRMVLNYDCDLESAITGLTKSYISIICMYLGTLDDVLDLTKGAVDVLKKLRKQVK
jgi:hypothetical protein